MNLAKRIITTLLVIVVALISTQGVEAAKTSKSKTNTTTNETLTNNCGSVSYERLNNNPATAPDCYGISQIKGEFSNRNDIDWVRQFPIKSGTQSVYVYANGKTKVNLYIGRRLVERGYTATRGWVRLSTLVNVNVPGQDILGVQLSGDRGVTYTVTFPDVVKNPIRTR